jgi:hypothetical protein
MRWFVEQQRRRKEGVGRNIVIQLLLMKWRRRLDRASQRSSAIG